MQIDQRRSNDFLGTEMLATRAFLIFALAVGDEGYTQKARVASNKQRHNTRQLVFVIVGSHYR
jgi:hypothetical protein